MLCLLVKYIILLIGLIVNKRFFKPRANQALNDKLLNLSALFFTATVMIFFTVNNPITIAGSFTSLGLMFYSVMFVLIPLSIEVYGVRLTKKLVLAGIYGLMFACVLQIFVFFNALASSKGPFFIAIKGVLLDFAVSLVVYTVSSYFIIYIYRYVKNKVKDYLIVRHTATIVLGSIVLVGLYYVLASIFKLPAAGSLKLEIGLRSALWVVQVFLLYVLVGWLANKHTSNFNNNNRNFKGNRNFNKNFNKDRNNNFTAKSTDFVANNVNEVKDTSFKAVDAKPNVANKPRNNRYKNNFNKNKVKSSVVSADKPVDTNANTSNNNSN